MEILEFLCPCCNELVRFDFKTMSPLPYPVNDQDEEEIRSELNIEFG